MESLDLDASGRSDITVSRSSSLIANFRLDDYQDGEMKDLFVFVDNPEKHSGTIETYITFRVSTKVVTIKTLLVLNNIKTNSIFKRSLIFSFMKYYNYNFFVASLNLLIIYIHHFLIYSIHYYFH